MAPRVRVFIACSLDGFIAGEGDDLSWLPGADGTELADLEDDGGHGAFMAQVGALLMGRRTHDVVAGFDLDWPYGERPVLVATRRPLRPGAPTVRAVAGPIAALVDEARAVAGELDVYLDGGDLVRQALDAGLVDELIVTMIPTVLGRGVPLFAGAHQRHALDLVESHPVLGGRAVQLRLAPVRG